MKKFQSGQHLLIVYLNKIKHIMRSFVNYVRFLVSEIPCQRKFFFSDPHPLECDVICNQALTKKVKKKFCNNFFVENLRNEFLNCALKL
jgi:hypothetical protein